MGAAPPDEKTIGLGRSPSGSAPSDIQVGGVVASDSGAGVATQYGETKRGLSPRHVQLMAIGGSIGTGLWIGIGGVLTKAGPLSLVLGYMFWGLLFIWPLNLCVAEMCAYLPIRGSIFELSSRFVDPALGFAMGWTYFFAGLMLVCTEYSAIATVIQYWDPTINPGAWIAVAMFSCIIVNVVAVKWYGEAEFVMASTKVLLLFGLILITIITMAGGNPRGDAYGFRNWGNGNFIHPYRGEGATGNFLGWWKVVIYAGFTIAGPDMIALAAGEIQNPRYTIPRVANLVFYRLVGFYVIGVLCVGIICSSVDPGLLDAIKNKKPGAFSSPWVVGIERLGINVLPHIINAAIMLSGWSCGNAYLYSASRTLYGLARDNQAPKIFLKCTKEGVPIYCVAGVSLISCITFLVSSDSAVTVFFWFVDLTTTALIMTYTMMMIAYLGFYRARNVQGMDPATLPYLAPFTPYSSYVTLILGCTAVLFVGFDTFSPFEYRDFITAYFAFPFGVVMFIGYKVFKKTSFVKPAEADLISGKKEVDEECRHWEEGGIQENVRARLAEMSFLRRTWEKMW
ncbi:proline permease [Magnaporthiopsis poae ATCC 64411]|uniref:Proline permease n=1 Tax=Magnaporthiopsis poae (strain ATCC 64411 / 73-15) TaxID=644358 RepID=A0A0C4EBZ4_MAGP6|nr:proline permease [Magnaporthiopsis poae ATCC 64411]